MTLPQINLDADTAHLILTAFLGFVAYELRQWRVWWQSQHGGAPDQKP
jgi:hypothetical protein